MWVCARVRVRLRVSACGGNVGVYARARARRCGRLRESVM